MLCLNKKRQKLYAKSIRGHLVGYCDDKDRFRVYIPSRVDVISSRDGIFTDELTTS
jgi:hypothetical protein